MNLTQQEREKMILDNANLIYTAMKPYVGLAEFEDLHSEGMEALIIAVDKFDPSYGNQFSTYAVSAIRNKLKRFVVKEDDVRIPEYLNRGMVALAAAISEIESNGLVPSPELIAEKMEIDVDEAAAMYRLYVMKHTVSTDTLNENGDTIGSNIADTTNVEDIVEKADRTAIILEALQKVYGEKTAAIIAYRYGLGMSQEHTLEETGSKFNITRERVRQIVSAAIEGNEKSPHSQRKVEALRAMLQSV